MVFTIVSRTQIHIHITVSLLSKNKAKKKGNALVRYTTHILVYVAVKFNFLPTHTLSIFFNFCCCCWFPAHPHSSSLFYTFYYTYIVYSCHRLRVQTHVKAYVCVWCFRLYRNKSQIVSSRFKSSLEFSLFFFFLLVRVCASACVYCIQCDGFLYL